LAAPLIFARLHSSNRGSWGLSRRMSRLVLLHYDPARYIITIFLRLDPGIPVGSREIRKIYLPLKSLPYFCGIRQSRFRMIRGGTREATPPWRRQGNCIQSCLWNSKISKAPSPGRLEQLHKDALSRSAIRSPYNLPHHMPPKITWPSAPQNASQSTSKYPLTSAILRLLCKLPP
jgi:hypothetical protein